MAPRKKKEKFSFEEWNIDNFSFWNSEIHGELITTSKSTVSFDLFPRGLWGIGEYLVVRLRCDLMPINFSGDVSFISSDGSLLGTQQFGRETKILVVITGLKFDKVCTEIRKNIILHKDRLTVRFRLRTNKIVCAYRHTVIDVHDVSFKISPKILGDLNSKTEIISLLQYHFDEGEVGRIVLDVSTDEIDDSKTVLTLSPFTFKKNVLVLTCTSVLNNEDKVVRNEENKHIFRNMDTWTFSKSLKIEKKFSLDVNLKFIPSTKYTQCFCLLDVYPEVVVSMPTNSSGLPSTSSSKEHFSRSLTSADPIQTYNSTTMLAKELMCLYQDQDFSDFQLKCGTVSFPVHKNILSARSPVFKIMLSSDMREAASGEVVIGDLDPSTLTRFLAFLYTGTVEDLECDSALKLYYASDKYHVQTLKEESTSFLRANVSISNVGDILSLSSKHQDDRLRDVARDFILKNYNEVLGSEEWKDFLRSEPLLVAETLSSLFAEKKYVRKSNAT